MTEKLSANEIAAKCGYFDENFKDIKSRIKSSAEKTGRSEEDIILLAASKTVDVAVINHAIENGLDYIGENRVQEFLSKNDDLLPVHKHFIGHLQTNKVKDIVGKVEMIESVDSVKLAREISKYSVKYGVGTDILIEVNIGGEENKSGVEPENLENLVREVAVLPAIHLKGLMAIPPICDDEVTLRKYFAKMYNLFIDIRSKNIDNSSMEYLSMGMSSDFDIAIEEGANIVRIGSSLFGKRNYI